MSENPAIQDYIQEHIQRSKWWDWNGEKMSDEKGKTLAIEGGHSTIPSASTMKISRYCIQRGGPDDTTFEHAKAPPPPPSRVGGDISFPSSSRASGSEELANLGPPPRTSRPRSTPPVAPTSKTAVSKRQIRDRTSTRSPSHRTNEPYQARYGKAAGATCAS
jgi:hypothetical protein